MSAKENKKASGEKEKQATNAIPNQTKKKRTKSPNAGRKKSKEITIDTPLTVQEEKFVEAYIEKGNASDAVREAGYRCKTPQTIASFGSRKLKQVNIAYQIKIRMEARARASIMTAQEVMEYFSAVARGEVKDAFGLDASLSERTRAAQEIAKRTIDIENRLAGKADAKVEVIKIDWSRD